MLLEGKCFRKRCSKSTNEGEKRSSCVETLEGMVEVFEVGEGC